MGTSPAVRRPVLTSSAMNLEAMTPNKVGHRTGIGRGLLRGEALSSQRTGAGSGVATAGSRERGAGRRVQAARVRVPRRAAPALSGTVMARSRECGAEERVERVKLVFNGLAAGKGAARNLGGHGLRPLPPLWRVTGFACVQTHQITGTALLCQLDLHKAVKIASAERHTKRHKQGETC